MKTLKLYLFLLFCLVLIFSCEKTLEEPQLNDSSEELLSKEKSNFSGFSSGAIVFDARARTSGAENPAPSKCPAGLLDADQRGKGKANRLGGFTTKITFCSDPSQLIIGPNGFPIGGSVPYFGTEGIITFRNGDEYYFSGSGRVVLDLDNPRYDAFFNDLFRINGAKINGVYKQASGYIQTRSQVMNIFTPGEYTNHQWFGLINIHN